jgi:hypothetical protein
MLGMPGMTRVVAISTEPILQDQPSQPGSPVKTKQGRLEVAVWQERDEWLVKISLSNTGDTPIIVDRELVMGITIEVDGSEGARIYHKSEAEPDRSSSEAPKKRLTSLSPNQTLSRTLSLTRGWRVFRGGEGVDSQSRTIAVTGYEETVGRSTNAKPRIITVTYGKMAYFWEGFLGYTGITLKEAKLYLGPLEQSLELVEE